MIEKKFTLEDVSPLDILGVENQNIEALATAFPKSKIISRGNEIVIKGDSPDVVQLTDILQSLVKHYHQYGHITKDHLEAYIGNEGSTAVHPPADNVIVYAARGAAVKPRTANQGKLVEAVYEHDIVFAVGPAGTGKTFISVALAVRALKFKEVKKIIITRPAVEAGENLGFLPGDLKEKVDPYLKPIYDALNDLISPEKLKYYLEREIIEIAPLAYMRGRTLNNAFVLLDEAQNTTRVQMKMFLTRLGRDAKMIVTGDLTQIDLPVGQQSGLRDAVGILKHVKGIGLVQLTGADVARHDLVRRIVSAYQKDPAPGKA